MNKLKRKSWVILCRRIHDDTLFGYFENEKQFSSTYVTVYRSWRNPTYHNVNEKVDAIALQEFVKKAKNASWFNPNKFEIFISRVGSKNCPIKVNWSGVIDSGKRRPSETYQSKINVRLIKKSAESVDEEINPN